MKEVWQQNLDAAFDKYFAMAKILNRDVALLLDQEDGSEYARRNFVRASASLIEGYAHCFREMCEVGLETGPGILTKKEVEVLRDERGFTSVERIKYTLRGTYKMFELQTIPDFSEAGWADTQAFVAKRDALMHPKSVSDLAITEKQWEQTRDGATWVFKQLFDVMALIAVKHGSKEQQ